MTKRPQRVNVDSDGADLSSKETDKAKTIVPTVKNSLRRSTRVITPKKQLIPGPSVSQSRKNGLLASKIQNIILYAKGSSKVEEVIVDSEESDLDLDTDPSESRESIVPEVREPFSPLIR